MEDSWSSVDLPVRYKALANNSEAAYHNYPSILRLDVKGACARCVVVNVFKDGMIVDGRLLQTIATYRKQTSTTNSSGGINFGQYFNWNEDSNDFLNSLRPQNIDEPMGWVQLDSLCKVSYSC